MVSKGNFDVKATAHVKSHDEVGDLAKAFDHMTDGLKERDKVKSLFSKFHGSSVAEDLINKDIGVGGQSKEVVVFFSDIRGFTAFSEKRKPEEVVAMLNEYFAVMVGIINKHGGVVDKFIGDAIMAIWGAPKGSDRDPHNALRACIEMRRGLEKLNEARIARGEPALMIGMGLHAGTAISGTIGSDERMEYTVIGNTVNTASRIEASTKAFGADLLVTDDVISRVGEEFIVDYAGSAEVKGRSDALKMYKIRGYVENGEKHVVKTPYSDYEAEGADKVKVKDAA
jgi:adenylate cyclase